MSTFSRPNELTPPLATKTNTNVFVADKALRRVQTVLPTLEGTLRRMRYRGTCIIQVGFHEITFRESGRILEEITLTLDSPLKGSKDVIRKALAVLFHPFSARIRLPKGREIYICAQTHNVVPPKEFEAAAGRSSFYNIDIFPLPHLRGEGGES